MWVIWQFGLLIYGLETGLKCILMGNSRRLGIGVGGGGGGGRRIEEVEGGGGGRKGIEEVTVG